MKHLLIFCLLFLALCVTPADATIALTQHTNKDAGSVTTTNLAYGSNIGANHLLLVVIRSGGSSTTRPFSVSDTLTNTWTGLSANDGSSQGAGQSQLWWAISGGAGADTVTVSITGSAQTLRIAIYEYSGTATASPVDTENNTLNGASGDAHSNSVTPAQSGELVIAFASLAANCSPTAGTSFTMEDVVPASPNARLAVEDWVQTTATATTGVTTSLSGVGWSAGIAVFKPAGAAVTCSNTIALLGVGCK